MNKDNRRKAAVLRGILGIPIGITIGYLITIFISLAVADGYYSPCVPELAEELGSEINAVLLQTLLCALLGAVFGAASVIWEIDAWSLMKQTGIYFLVISLGMFPTAYLARWMEHTVKGFLIYFGIFFGIAVVIWITQYLFWRGKVRRMREKMGKQTGSGSGNPDKTAGL